MRLEDVLAKLNKVKRYRGGYMACCPAHDDRNPSLSIKEVEDGKVLMHCFAGCSYEEVVRALGMDRGGR